MQSYDLRRGQAKAIEGGNLRALATEIFGAAETDDEKVVVSFGALERLLVWSDGKSLFVETTMKPGVPDAVATDTIKAYNRFLEQATGYSAKERGKRAQKKAKEGKM
ncbi:MAG: hypothetical protein A3K68_06690 [Euryarchaeota archaeon RBG_16_68_13]|nr:MAG: hypothetical protein A3K68_06690 [Euryarchaeota archaeon RBG_16_68_13]